MNYQLWTKNEYEGWSKVDCEDVPAVHREIEKAIRAGKEPLVTMEVSYDINIKLKEVLNGEIKKSKAKPGESTIGESDRKVRRTDEPAIEELDKGSGDPGSSSDTRD